MMALSVAAACSVLPPLGARPARASRPQRPALAIAHPCRRRSVQAAAAARPEDEIEPVPPALLSALSSEDELQQEAGWLSDMIQCWLDEEWAAQELLEVHAQLGAATGQAYVRLRRQEGVSEMGDLVLGLATELMTSFDFMPTFTSAFEVSNKATELLMLRGGVTCSCSDPGAIARYEAALAADRQQ
ncbi:hypothetical protein C2E21_4288 [Chlorella sorokiniana]|uniref:Uncharacterized protein n=1 Tax=Chlorella sorokiniana TaxID=3076 RepID=A0A2P6TTW7_CHLSO|nr:hypothetical protein C2E21_4288 [Chlorella sorokiniana]|eukprot:PRW57522.1 hypothetical protein C2E21_4288 [Chlorella sorokiniana]